MLIEVSDSEFFSESGFKDREFTLIFDQKDVRVDFKKHHEIEDLLYDTCQDATILFLKKKLHVSFSRNGVSFKSALKSAIKSVHPILVDAEWSAKKLQNELDEQYGAGIFTVGFDPEKIYVYEHKKGFVRKRNRPNWLSEKFEIQFVYIGKMVPAQYLGN